MFVILEDDRKGLSIAPQKWVIVEESGQEIIYWPKKNLTKLQNDPNSEPIVSGESQWLIVKDTIKRRGIKTLEEAEEEIEKMMQISQTEKDDEDTDGEGGRRKTRADKHSEKEICKSPIPKFVIESSVLFKLNSAIAQTSDTANTKRLCYG